MIGFANNGQPRRCSFVDSVTRPAVLVVAAVLMLAFLAPRHCSEAAAAPVVDKTELPLGEVVDRFVWLSSQTCLLITGRGSLYRSRDGGGTWISQDSALLAAVNASTSTAAHGSVQVTSVHPSADPTKAMIIGKKDEQAVLWLYRSGIDSERQPQDSLKVSYTAVSLTQSLFDASMHATEPGWALALRWSSDCPLGSNCNQELMLTQDLGLTWQQVATKVRQYSWADIKTSTRSKQQIWLVWEDEQEDVDYATTQSRWAPGQELSIGHTDDFGQRFTVWKRAAPRFTYTAPFIFVSVVCVLRLASTRSSASASA
ncbi:vacuolar protein sorting/targeting protein PEP1, partial [Balamuthia mandrillaris]